VQPHDLTLAFRAQRAGILGWRRPQPSTRFTNEIEQPTCHRSARRDLTRCLVTMRTPTRWQTNAGNSSTVEMHHRDGSWGFGGLGTPKQPKK
jgi:hypothetical protein